VDLSKPIDFIGESNELSQPYRNIYFADYLRHNKPVESQFSAYAVITEIYPTSKFYTRDYKIQHEWKLGRRYEIENNPYWQLHAEKQFKNLGLNVNIYTSRVN